MRAWTAHLLGQVDAIAPLLGEVEQLLDGLEPTDSIGHPDASTAAALRAESTALQSFLARMDGSYEDALKLSGAALQDLPETAYGLRSLVNGNLGEVYYLRGELDKAHDFHREESRLAEKEGAVLPSRFALWRIAEIQTLRGELEAAKKTCHTMLNLNKVRSVDALGFADVQLGVVALEQNKLQEAEKRLSVGLELGKRLGNPRVFAPGYGPLAKTLLARGCPTDAQEVLAEGLELTTQYGVGETWGLPPLTTWQAYLDLRTGALERASAWAQRAGLIDLPGLPEVAFTNSFDALVAVRILLAKNRAEDALSLLRLPAVQVSRPTEVGALRALALAALGREEALDVLEQTLAAAAKNTHIFTFLDEGAAMQELLQTLKAAG